MHAVVDFNGTVQTIEVVTGTTSSPASAEVSISVYNDGIPEGEEGFVVVLYVAEGKLDERDVGFVNVEDSVLLVRMKEGGKNTQRQDTEQLTNSFLL